MKQLTVRSLVAIILLALSLASAPTTVHAQTFTSLYEFNLDNGDPWFFAAPGTLAQGPDGNIHTTSVSLGPVIADGLAGSVFSMTSGGLPAVQHPFTVGDGGETPYGGLTLGADTNLYGTVGPDSIQGGGCNGLGSAFQVTPSGSLTYLYFFPTTGAQGGDPFQAPLEGTDGNFYGTTHATNVCGVVVDSTIYQLAPASNPPWNLITLYDGGGINQTLSFQGTDGNFYGFTYRTVFKVTPSVPSTYTQVFDFGFQANIQGLIQGSDGNYYGVTYYGGSFPQQGLIFKLTKTGKLTVLHYFDPSAQDGFNPYSGVVQGTDGYLYGVTSSGGTSGWGTIYRISTRGTGYQVLYNFTDGGDGGYAQVALLQHTNGKFYGLTEQGGICNQSGYCGGVFYSLDMTLKPFASLVSTSGPVGATIGILGQGFTGTKKVLFFGVAATFTVVSDTYLTATVPNGAIKGFVTVRTPGGALKSSKKFIVTQ